MRLIDRFAYNNRIRKLDPAWKAGFSLLLLLSLNTPGGFDEEDTNTANRALAHAYGMSHTVQPRLLIHLLSCSCCADASYVAIINYIISTNIL